MDAQVELPFLMSVLMVALLSIAEDGVERPEVLSFHRFEELSDSAPT